MCIEICFSQRLNTWVAMRLTYDTDLPDFSEGTLDVLDVRQTLVEIWPDNFTALWVAFCDGSENPTTTRDRHWMSLHFSVKERVHTTHLIHVLNLNEVEEFAVLLINLPLLYWINYAGHADKSTSIWVIPAPALQGRTYINQTWMSRQIERMLPINQIRRYLESEDNDYKWLNWWSLNVRIK